MDRQTDVGDRALAEPGDEVETDGGRERHDCDQQQLKSFLHSKDMEKRLRAIHAKVNLDVNKSNMLVTMKIPVS